MLATKTIMKKFYFDTSAINHLFDDPQSISLLNSNSENIRIFISVFTVAELASTPDQERRNALLKLAKIITDNYRPAAMPADLLKRSLETINARKLDMEHSMGQEWDGIWLALNNPELIDEDDFCEVVRWKADQERWFHDLHNDGRPMVQQRLNDFSATDKNEIAKRFSKFIQKYRPDSEFAINTVSNIASRVGADLTISDELIKGIIKQSEHWRFFLVSFLYCMYARAFKMQNHGRKNNPGSIDTQQSIYLTICDVFVTADKRQHDMLRLISPFGHKKRQVWSFEQFAKWLTTVST